MGIVDVRDVSKLHLEGIRVPEAANNRFIAYSEPIFEKEIAAAFHERFGPLGFTVPTEVLVSDYEKDAKINNEKSKKTFGMEFIPAKEACLAMA